MNKNNTQKLVNPFEIALVKEVIHLDEKSLIYRCIASKKDMKYIKNGIYQTGKNINIVAITGNNEYFIGQIVDFDISKINSVDMEDYPVMIHRDEKEDLEIIREWDNSVVTYTKNVSNERMQIIKDGVVNVLKNGATMFIKTGENEYYFITA